MAPPVSIQSQTLGTSNLCLDVAAANGNQSSVVADSYTCNGTRAQVFQLNSDGTITNYWGNCLDIVGGSPADGAVDFTACNGSNAQQWGLGPQVSPNDQAIVATKFSGYCLTTTSSTPGASVGVASCTSSVPTTAQQWSIVQPLTTPTPSTTPAGFAADFMWGQIPAPPQGAKSIGVGAGDPWIIGLDGQPYRYAGTPGNRSWQLFPIATIAVRIVVSPEGNPWLIDFAGHIFRYSFITGQWTLFPGPSNCTIDLAVGGDNQLVALGCAQNATGNYLYYVWTGSLWALPAAAPGAGVRVAISPEGLPWMIDNKNVVWRWENGGIGGWYNVGSGATAIGAGPNRTQGATGIANVWTISNVSAGGSDFYPYTWNGTAFVQGSSVTAKEISVGADGTPWIVTSTNKVARWGGSWRSLASRHGLLVGGGHWTGDVEDIDVSDFANNRVVVGTAGGGVWLLNFVAVNNGLSTWTPISDTGFAPGPSQAVASVAQKPGDPNKTLVVATGIVSGNDVNSQLGNGIWQGSLSGTAWQWTPLPCADKNNNPITCPGSFTKIRYGRANSSVIYASSTGGFFTSSGGGAFTQAVMVDSNNNPINNAFVLDIAEQSDGKRVYAAVQGAGIEVSTDSGKTFGATTFPQGGTLTAALFSNAKIALAPSNDAIMYLRLDGPNQGCNFPEDDFEGIFVSKNINSASPSWTETGFAGCQEYDGCAYQCGIDDWMRSQNGHDGAIVVSPNDSNSVVAAGVKPYVTTNGGGTFPKSTNCSSCPAPNSKGQRGGPAVTGWTGGTSTLGVFHADFHALAIDSVTGTVWAGTDGGIFTSADGGTTWQDNVNTIPIENTKGFGVLGDTIVGASWDTGLHWSLDHGTTWYSEDDDSLNAHVVASNNWYGLTWGGPSKLYQDTSGGTGDAWAITSVNTVAQVGGTNSPRYQITDLVNNNTQWVFGGPATINSTVWKGVIALQGTQSGINTYGIPFANAPGSVTAVNYNKNLYVFAGAFLNSSNSTQNLQMTSNGGQSYTEVGGIGFGSLPFGGGNNIAVVRRDDANTSDPYIYVLTFNGRVFANDMGNITGAIALGLGPAWVEITGNLPSNDGSRPVNNPNLVFNDIVADSTRGTVVVATNAGLFKLVNSCATTVVLNRFQSCWTQQLTWLPWNEGFPLAFPSVGSLSGTVSGTPVNALESQTRSDGRFYIYAGVWGRGVFVRDASAEDP
jgi:hypothetical protein